MFWFLIIPVSYLSNKYSCNTEHYILAHRHTKSRTSKKPCLLSPLTKNILDCTLFFVNIEFRKNFIFVAL